MHIISDMGEYDGTDGVGVSIENAVLSVVLDRPRSRNALTDDMVLALIRVLESASTDDTLRAIALTGGGDHFCGGFDIAGRNSSVEAKPRTGSIQRRMPTASSRLVQLVLEVQLPVVCAVRGWAAGIGAQLAVAADFTIAAEDSTFWWPFIDRGFTPDSGASWLLPRRVGVVRSRELLLLGRRLSGVEAVEWGLIHAAVADELVPSAAADLVSSLASGPTAALGLTKSLLAASPDNDVARQFAAEAYAMELSSRSPDFREGIAALVQKRKPEFGGR